MLDQLDIFDAPVARADDPSTSWDAARSVTLRTEKQSAVLETLRRIGEGTDEDIARAYRGPAQSPSGLRTRRKELCAMDLVMDSGRQAKLSTGRMATVWECA